MALSNDLLGGKDFIRNRYLVYDDLNDTFDEFVNVIEDRKIIHNQVAYFKLDGDINDAHSTFNLTNNGASSTGSGKINGAYIFDGNNDYMENTSLTTGGASFTINMWIKTSDTTNIQLLAGHAVGGSDYWAFHIRGGRLAFFVRGSYGTSVSIQNIGNIVADGTWHMVSVIKNGTTVTLYDDTVSQNSGTTSAVLSETGDFEIGMLATGSFWAYDGTIDEVGIWDVEKLYYLNGLYNGGLGLQYPFTGS